VKTLFIEPAIPWENGHNESSNGKLRVEMLNGEIFHTIEEAKVLIERWRNHYNTVRPRSALECRPPAAHTRSSGRPNPAFATHRPQPDQAFPYS